MILLFLVLCLPISGFFSVLDISAQEIEINPEVSQYVKQQISNNITKNFTRAAEPERTEPLPMKTDFLRSLKDLQGSFDVQLFSGTASYTYPIKIPSGRLGMTPNINLSYSSNNRRYDSLIGFGWDLSLDSIYRNTTKGSDKLYDQNDFSVMVNGQSHDLVLVDDVNDVYQAEIESDFSQYAFDNTGNSWEIIDNSGNTYTFGTTANGRQDDPNDGSRVHRWMLERVEDVHGNFMTYTYFKDAGQIYPDRIRYTGFDTDQGLYEVRFLRSSGNEYSSYSRGFKTTNNYILSNIELYEYSSGLPELVYEYEITHNDSLLPALTFPESFQLKTASESLPKTEFEYYDGTEQIPGKKRGLLKTITEPLGGETTLSYKPSTAYRTTWGTAGMQNSIPFVMHTLHERTTQANSFSPAYTTRYEYENGHYYYDNLDAYKKEYAGFGNVVIEHPDGNEEELFFHQSEFSEDNSAIGEFNDHLSKKGRIYRTESRDSLGNLYTLNIKKWDTELLLDSDPEKERFFIFLETDITTEYDGNSSHRSTASAFDYDSYGNKTFQKNFGEVLLDSNDGAFTDIGTDWTETSTEYVHNVSPALHNFPKQTTRTDSGGNILGKNTYYYDLLGYNSINKGLLTKTETQVNSVGYIVATSKNYNGFGLPTDDTNARGFTTEVTYDSFNLYPETIINPKGHETYTTYDYRFGVQKTVTDPNDATTETIYDDFGRSIQVKMTDPDNLGTLLVQSETTYDMALFPRSISQENFTYNGGITKKSVSYLDGFGETIQTYAQVDQPGSNTYIKSGKITDSRGRTRKEFFPVFSGTNVFVIPTGSELGTGYAYDPLGRPLAIETPVGVTTNIYDQWNTKTTDAESKVKEYETDDQGNLVRVIEHLNGTPYETVYHYNRNKNLIKIVDAVGNEREMTYDLLGRRLSKEKLHASGASGNVWSYQYDENGNLVEETEPDGTVIVREYDELDRPLVEDDLSVSGIQNQYAYDIFTNGIGRLGKVISEGATTKYGYDILGRTIYEGSSINGNFYETTMTYDFLGSPKTITNPNGETTAYSYNSSGLLGTIEYNGEPIVNTLEYSPTLAPSKISYANGVVTDNVYDISQNYFLTQKQTVSPSSQILQSIEYEYDGVGNIISLTNTSDTHLAKTSTYQYDDLHRLIIDETVDASPNNYLREYSYDILGNIVAKSDQIGAYAYGGSHPHAVTAIGGQTLAYDLNGNLSNDGIWTHTWNWQNRIRQSTDGTDTISYKYDHGGTRKLKNDITNSKKTIYVNKYFDKEESQEKTYIYAGNKKVATFSSDDGLIFHHEDHLTGSSVDTDISGNINQIKDYFPFGDDRIDHTTGTFENDYGFTGKERDTETDLMYYDARYYNSGIGRFISIDAWEGDLKDPQTLNKYSYVRNNPVKYVDPSGNVLETAWDVGNVIHDVGRGLGAISAYTYGAVTGNEALKQVAASGLKQIGTDLAVDAAATFIPFVPAGSTKVGRGAVKNADSIFVATKNKVSTFADKFKASREQMKNLSHREIKPFKDAQHKADKYGGISSDYSKQSSRSFDLGNGKTMETHSVKNIKTGKVYERKTKFQKKGSKGSNSKKSKN